MSRTSRHDSLVDRSENAAAVGVEHFDADAVPEAHVFRLDASAICELDRTPLRMFLIMIAGSVVIFGLGLGQLSRFVPADSLLAAGLLPFIPGDLIKAALAAAVFPATWKLVDRFGGRA